MAASTPETKAVHHAHKTETYAEKPTPSTASLASVKPADVERGDRDDDDRHQTRWQRFVRLASDGVPPGDPGPPPDKGLRAWSQAVGCCMVIAATWGYVTSYGVFQTYLQTVLPESPSAISWIGSFQIFLLFAFSLVSGRLLDAGFFRATFLAGMALQLVGIFTTSVATKYWQLFLAQGVCLGVGNAAMFCPSVAVVSSWFSSNKTFAISVGALGSALGSMLFAGIVKAMLEPVGFPWTVRTLGFVVCTLDVGALALIRTRLPPRRSGPLVEWTAFREAPFMLYCSGMFCIFWGLYLAFFYVGAFSRDIIGFDYSHSINLLIVMNGVGVIGRLVPGFVADRWIGPLNAIVPSGMLLALMMWVWAAVDSATGLYVFSSFYGLAAAGIQALWPGTLSSLTTDLSKAGSRTGLGFALVSLACLTGTPIGGALIDAGHGSYLYAQMFAGASLTCGTMLLVAARLSRSGFVLWSRV